MFPYSCGCKCVSCLPKLYLQESGVCRGLVVFLLFDIRTERCSFCKTLAKESNSRATNILQYFFLGEEKVSLGSRYIRKFQDITEQR